MKKAPQGAFFVFIESAPDTQAGSGAGWLVGRPA